MAPPPPFRHTPQTFPAPQGTPPRLQWVRPHVAATLISARSSHVSCPSGSSTKGSRLEPPIAAAWRRSAHFGKPLKHVLPPWSFIKGPSWCVRAAPPRSFRHTPHTFPAPQGAPPRAPVGASALRRRAQFGTPFTRVVRGSHFDTPIPRTVPYGEFHI